MGLFSSNKNPCPICGEATPRLLPTKVEGAPICKDCANKIDLPDGVLNTMSLTAFKEYLACYDANQPLREAFSHNYAYGGGLFGGNALEINTESRQFRLKGGKGSGSFVFEAGELVSFSIQEDDRPLFTGDANGLVCHESDLNARLDQMESSIQYFLERKRDYERMENLERLHDRFSDDHNDHNRPYHSRPIFDVKNPIENFRIVLTMNHPYWPHFEREDLAPRMDQDDPSTYNYRIKYDEEVNTLYELANALLAVIAPGAPVTQAAAPAATQPAVPAAAAPAAAPAVDAVSEIQRFKTLLDAGIITEEEFAAKKRQLMGI